MSDILDIIKNFPDNDACKSHLEKVRWNNKPRCPNCKANHKAYVLGKHSYKCSVCCKKFNVLIGSVFENTKIPLQKWFLATYLLTSSKKGISSLQLSRDLGITQKSAWFMLHRIRKMLQNKAPYMLQGDIEVDETYIGGKNKNRHANKKVKNAQGRSFKDKIAVLGILERKGKVITKVVSNVSASKLNPIVTSSVTRKSTIYTDEWLGYSNLKKTHQHSIVRHCIGQYVNGKAHTNTIEGFWSILKRGIVGIYHYTSKKHLNRYLDEFTYRYNTISFDPYERFTTSIKQCDQRLTYKELIKTPA